MSTPGAVVLRTWKLARNGPGIPAIIGATQADRVGTGCNFDRGPQEGMAGGRSERIIADFPVHSSCAQVGIDREFFEGENAGVGCQLGDVAGKEDIEIEIKSAQPIDREVTEKIDSLDGKRKGVKRGAIFRKLPIDESRDVAVVEIDVLEWGSGG